MKLRVVGVGIKADGSKEAFFVTKKVSKAGLEVILRKYKSSVLVGNPNADLITAEVGDKTDSMNAVKYGGFIDGLGGCKPTLHLQVSEAGIGKNWGTGEETAAQKMDLPKSPRIAGDAAPKSEGLQVISAAPGELFIPEAERGDWQRVNRLVTELLGRK